MSARWGVVSSLIAKALYLRHFHKVSLRVQQLKKVYLDDAQEEQVQLKPPVYEGKT